MNSDKVTTIVGLIVGLLVIVGGLTQEKAYTLQQAGTIIAGILIGIWGHATNKEY